MGMPDGRFLSLTIPAWPVHQDPACSSASTGVSVEREEASQCGYIGLIRICLNSQNCLTPSAGTYWGGPGCGLTVVGRHGWGCLASLYLAAPVAHLVRRLATNAL